MNKEELQAFDNAIEALRLDDMNHSADVLQSLKSKLTQPQHMVGDGTKDGLLKEVIFGNLSKADFWNELDKLTPQAKESELVEWIWQNAVQCPNTYKVKYSWIYNEKVYTSKELLTQFRNNQNNED